MFVAVRNEKVEREAAGKVMGCDYLNDLVMVTPIQTILVDAKAEIGGLQ